MTQLNTPYPATAYLTGFLRSRGYNAVQADPAMSLVLKLFSQKGLKDVAHDISQKKSLKSPHIEAFKANLEKYLRTVDPVIRFLQGLDPSLALRLVSRKFVPEGPSFAAMAQWEELGDPDLSWAFGTMGIQDKAKFIASLYLDDIAQVVGAGIDELFTLSRYGERLAASVPSFDPMVEALRATPTLVARYLDAITDDLMKHHQPDVVGFTVPFPGNLLGALKMAQRIKAGHSQVKTIMGGGYVNTELRELSEPRLFDSIDFVTLDDGEMPLLAILEHLSGKRSNQELFRTFVRHDQKVVMITNAKDKDIHHNDTGIPTYDGLPLGQYLSLVEMLNPMHRIWSDGRWNKLTLAHGCYWNQCNFCDVSLDYIQRYQEADIDILMSRIRAAIAETGQSGFHFVDEAAPPKILFALARRLIDEGLSITWWGNIRFEKSFTPAMTRLLAESGCVAVTGGLEVASNRLLKLMNKGVTVEQVARVTRSFGEAGILVHAYLMYGFPSQTEQETIDALERVRQLFLNGCLDSAYWHRFAATVHSPIGINPEKFGIKIIPRPANAFSKNDLDFEDSVLCDHDRLGAGLKKALYNYMLGIGLEEPLSFWFDKKIPKTTLEPDFIRNILANR